MRIAYLDLETYWSTTHTLTKMNPVAYCMHKDTEIQSLAYAFDDGPVEFLFGEWAIREFIHGEDWSDVLVVGHNMSGFDSMILRWRLKLRPWLWGCTLAMARPLFASELPSLSLKALAAHLGVGQKGDFEAVRSKGRVLSHFTPYEVLKLKEYNRQDVELCRSLFRAMLPQTPRRELWVIDATIRMLLDARLRVDVPLLEQTLADEQARKAEALEQLQNRLGLPFGFEIKDELMSNPKFAQLLRSLGVDPPTKISPTTGKETYAFAKNDEGLQALLEHENPLVVMAVATRLGVKSTMLETRIETFLTMARACGGRMPIALNYWGASTGRWSGGFKANQQNLPRVSAKTPKLSDALRRCLIVPPGHKIVVADLSGIELRVNHFLWQEPVSMALYAENAEADLYKDFAARFYGISIEEVTKDQRQFAKMMQLALGFGMGWRKFQIQAKLQGYSLTDQEAQLDVAKWRSIYPFIARGWKLCHTALRPIHDGEVVPIDQWGLCSTTKFGIQTPGAMLRYPKLHQEPDAEGKQEWWYGEGRGRSRIHGPKICIAAGTKVLTDSGWVFIEEVRASDMVHDGVSFVRHGGVVYNGVQHCVQVDGVRMTPDHEVLTDDGWQEASQFPRPYRPDLRHVDGASTAPQRRKKVALGVFVRLREAGCKAWASCAEGRSRGSSSQLWMRNSTLDWGEEYDSRYVAASSLRSVEVNAESVPHTIAQGMEKLWRSGGLRLRTLARRIQTFLGRHGRHIPTRAGYRPEGQRWPVLAGELPLGYSERELSEQTEGSSCGRYSDTSQGHGHIAQHFVLPSEERAKLDSSSGQAEGYPVYDITNAGPRRRFVVLGDDGPFIVHNCENLVQHLARQVLVGQMLKIRNRYPITHTVHDECIIVVPEHEAEKALSFMLETMKTPPKWWPELILFAEGDYGDNYGACK